MKCADGGGQTAELGHSPSTDDMSAEFVANMEDLLDLYAEPYDPRRPVVCFDETSTAGRGHSRRREDFVRCRH